MLPIQNSHTEIKDKLLPIIPTQNSYRSYCEKFDNSIYDMYIASLYIIK